MHIADNILRAQLANVCFINGTAYAGKSTMCRMLSERYGMLLCGENFGHERMLTMIDPQTQPHLNYFHTMGSWENFVTRTPEEYAAWVDGVAREVADFAVTELIRLSGMYPGKKIIADTNLPAEYLHRLSDYHRVAVMLSPQSLSVERFFDRSDPEKQMMLSVLDSLPDPAAAHANWRDCLRRVNSPEVYNAWLESGFYTIIREDDGKDTREAVLAKLAAHFGLTDES
ncbi:MAG: hypothetical protein IJ480_07285 [Clostridia bacterium]|nr:hypothetical protein [Clostridia bacterium]